MWTRRELLKAGAVGGAGMLLPWRGYVASAAAQSLPLDATTLMKYVDPLPVPGVLRPINVDSAGAHYQVAMTQFGQKLHRDLPRTTVWGYGDVREPQGVYPGPTIEARSGQPLTVKWTNNLPSRHILPIDPSIMGDLPPTRTVVHLHGAKILPDSDGYPDAWFTNGFAKTGPFFERKVYSYPNDQQATTLWYHDHADGITRLNVHTGLAGFYLIRDDREDDLNLPSGAYEIPLLLQDRMFNTDGSLNYPVVDQSADPLVPKIWIPEFFGDAAVVNGKVWPFLDVEPRKYRFRMLNGSNARFYHLTLLDRVGNAGPVFHQIGTDGGLLPHPVPLTDLLMAPAERFDVVIDFAGCQGSTFTLMNDAPDPFPGGGEVALPEIMQFRVTRRLRDMDRSSLPDTLGSVPLLDPAQARQHRDLMLSEWDSAIDGAPIVGLLGGSPRNATPDNPTGGLHWMDPVTEFVKAGSVEVWNLVNATTDGHPIHVHLVQFQVLNRQLFDLNRYLATGKIKLIGDPIPPDPNDRPAWKDTVKAFPGDPDNGIGKITRIIAKFDPPTGTSLKAGQSLRYLWHCHILEHEDNDMMRPWDLIG
jgi:spore coat protein A, manganese oxidase